MQRINMADGKKSRPIKAPPVLHLKINQHPENGEHDCRGQYLFFAHSRVRPLNLDSCATLYGTATWGQLNAGFISGRRFPFPEDFLQQRPCWRLLLTAKISRFGSAALWPCLGAPTLDFRQASCD